MYTPISKYSLDWGKRENLCKARQSLDRHLNRTSAKYKSEGNSGQLQQIVLVRMLSIILNFSTLKSSGKTAKLILRYLT
jgi:hypothetical protein